MSSVPTVATRRSPLALARRLAAHPLVPGAALSVLVQGFWIASQLGTSILLAKVLGPTAFGIYSFTWAVVTVLQFLPQNGLANAAVRFTATYRSANRPELAAGARRWFVQMALVYGGLTAAIVTALGVSGWLPTREAISPEALLFAAPVLLVFPLLTVLSAILRGARSGVAGQLPENVITPALLLCFVGLTVIFGPAQGMTPGVAMLLQAAAILLAAGFGYSLLSRSRAQHPQVQPAFESRLWIWSALPLSLMGALAVINNQASTLLLGGFASASDVAHFRIALQGASLVAVTLAAANLYLAPKIAALYSARDFDALQRLLAASAKLTFAVALVSAIGFCVLGRWLLEAIFGATYATAYPMLVILSIGQLINVGCGSVGTALNMMGHERDTLCCMALGAVANIALNVVLIPFWGGIGAAVASSTSLMIWNLAMVVALRHRTGLLCLPFSPNRTLRTT